MRRHLPTGRDTLYLGDTLSLEPVGMSPEDGRRVSTAPRGSKSRSELSALLGGQWMDELFRHATAERFVYKHAWERHDVVLWDNRRMM